GSVDGTAEILRSLKDEGLPIFLAQEPKADFDQQLLTNRLVRHIFATSEASWVFPLDADEFLRAQSREELEAALGASPLPTHLALDWCTYVPAFDHRGDPLAHLRAARRVAADGHGF